MDEKQMTGYPSIDRPQDRLYRKKPIRELAIEQTIYEMVFNANKNNMNWKALVYLGKAWSFQKLKDKADRYANAFVSSGLKKGDCVLIGVSNCPDAVAILLALNKIGVVSKWFDVRASEKDIECYANDSNCRYLIAFDMLIDRIKLALDNTNLEKVLIIKPTDCLSAIIQIVYAIKNKIRLPKDTRYHLFKNFVKDNYTNSNIPCVSFDKDRPSIMIQSSGTTGKPKIIVHSDCSATSSVKSLSYSDLPVEPQKNILDALPPWIAYALGQAILYPLTMGATVYLSPTFEPDTVMKYLGKFSLSFAAPFHYRYIRDNFGTLSKKEKESVYASECFASGGDKISAEENKAFEDLFKTSFINGYGNNEGWGALTVNSVKHNKYGSVGIAKYGETIIAYDNDSEKELPYGENGEICALVDTMFLYYEGNEEETKAVKRVHPDGKTWLHTGDLGNVDNEGFITLGGRARRVIVRQGFKISAYTIEDKITEHSAVKECVAVEVKDANEEHVPMVYIILKDDVTDTETAKQSIYDKCKSELKEYEIPKHFRIVTELPYTPNNKYDFRLLEQQGNEYVDSLNN